MKNHQNLSFFQKVVFEILCFCFVFFMNFHFFLKIKSQKTGNPHDVVISLFLCFFYSKYFRQSFFLSQDLCHLYRNKSLLKKKSKNHKMTPRRRCNLTRLTTQSGERSFKRLPSLISTTEAGV